jgi:hypothetical protein
MLVATLSLSAGSNTSSGCTGTVTITRSNAVAGSIRSHTVTLARSPLSLTMASSRRS